MVMASLSRVRLCAVFRVRATCGARRAGVRGGCRPFELDPGFNHCRPIVLPSAPKTEVDARMPLHDRALLGHMARNALVQLVRQLVSALQFQVVRVARRQYLRTVALRSEKGDSLLQLHLRLDRVRRVLEATGQGIVWICCSLLFRTKLIRSTRTSIWCGRGG